MSRTLMLFLLLLSSASGQDSFRDLEALLGSAQQQNVVVGTVAAPIKKVSGLSAPSQNPWVGDALAFADTTTTTIGTTAKSRHVVFSSDGSLIATDQPPTIWDASTLKPIAVADVYPRHTAGIEFMENGDLIAGSVGSFGVYRRDGRRLKLIHRVGPNVIAIQESPYIGRRDRIHLNASRQLLLVPGAKDAGATIFDLSGKYPKAVTRLTLLHTSAITNDFRVVAFRKGSSVVVLSRHSQAEPFREFDRKRGSHFRLSSNGVLITIDRKVFAIEEKELRQIATLESTSNVAFFGDSMGFAYVTRGPMVKVVRLNVDAGSISDIATEVSPTALALAPNDRQLATVDAQVGLRLYELEDGEWKETLRSSKRTTHHVPLKIIRFVDSNHLLCQRTSFADDATIADSLICVDVRSGNVTETPKLELENELKPIAFNSRKTNYLSHGPGVLAANGSLQITMEFEHHNHPVACLYAGAAQTGESWPIHDLREVAIAPDASRMAVGTYAGVIHIVDLSAHLSGPGKPGK